VHTYLFETTFIGIIASFLAHARVRLIGKRSMLFRRNKKYELLTSRLLNFLSTGIICVSDAVKRDVTEAEKGVGEKAVTIYNGVDVDLFENVPKLKERENDNSRRPLTIGYVGSLKPVKDLPALIEGMEALNRLNGNFRAVLVGEGPLYDDLARLISERGLTSKVFLIGPSSNIPETLKMIDIGVLTSTSEGLSNTLLEFMASGIPTVATSVGGNVEVIENGIDGFLVPVKNPKALAKRIYVLIKYPELYNSISAKCRKKAVEKFSIGKMVRSYEEYYFSHLMRVTGKKSLS